MHRRGEGGAKPFTIHYQDEPNGGNYRYTSNIGLKLHVAQIEVMSGQASGEAHQKSESPWSGGCTELLSEVVSSDFVTVACLLGTLPGLWELLLGLH